MNTIIKSISFAALGLTSSWSLAQMNQAELLEHLAVDEHTPLLELNVGQFITLMQNMPSNTLVCENFSALPWTQTYAPGSTHTIGGLTFHMNYSGGGRIAEFPGYPGQKFLEMVEDGDLVIQFPAAKDDVILRLIQGATQPNDITFYDQNYQPLGSTHTSTYSQVDDVLLPATGIQYVHISNPELLVAEVCYH